MTTEGARTSAAHTDSGVRRRTARSTRIAEGMAAISGPSGDQEWYVNPRPDQTHDARWDDDQRGIRHEQADKSLVNGASPADANRNGRNRRQDDQEPCAGRCCQRGRQHAAAQIATLSVPVRAQPRSPYAPANGRRCMPQPPGPLPTGPASDETGSLRGGLRTGRIPRSGDPFAQ